MKHFPSPQKVAPEGAAEPPQTLTRYRLGVCCEDTRLIADDGTDRLASPEDAVYLASEVQPLLDTLWQQLTDARLLAEGTSISYDKLKAEAAERIRDLMAGQASGAAAGQTCTPEENDRINAAITHDWEIFEAGRQHGIEHYPFGAAAGVSPALAQRIKRYFEMPNVWHENKMEANAILRECLKQFAAAVRAGGVPPPQLLTNDEVIVIREAVRSLDCGEHYCRYCAAKSPLWAHSEHCPYLRSQSLTEQARTILDRVQTAAAVRAGGVSPPKFTCADCGATMNAGEAQCFTVCDTCWDKAYKPVPAPVSEGSPRAPHAQERKTP